MSAQRSRLVLPGMAALALFASPAFAQLQNVLSPNDFIIAIDGNRNNLPAMPSPDGERVIFAIDGNPGSKYLNFGRETTGFIVSPASGSSVLQSFTLTTANDAPERDPAGYFLFGTNAPITSPEHSDGNAEAWTLIQRGTLALTDDRNQLQAPVNVTNSTAYTSYKLFFNPLKLASGGVPTNPDSMQIAEVQFYPQTGGSGSGLLAPTDPIRAIDVTDSGNPPNERPREAIDGIKTAASKYLNFGREGTGLIITPAAGPSVVRALRLTTANDVFQRDPDTYQLFGTNSPITSYEHSLGTDEPWTLISSGQLNLPGDAADPQRNVEGPIIEFPNSTAYASYKILFPTHKGSTVAIQFSEIELFVPEPGTAGVFAVAGLLTLARRRRRA